MPRDVAVAAQKPNGREADDFYATPASAIKQLLMVERFSKDVWEPACGNGAISCVLQAAGYSVISTDLIDRGYGQGGVDFLLETKTLAPNIITNPPFTLGTEFAEHAVDLVGFGKVAMLLKLGFLEGPTREALHRDLKRVWVIRRRITFLKGGREFSRSNGKGGIHSYAWFVWDRSYDGPVTVGWLEGEPCK